MTPLLHQALATAAKLHCLDPTNGAPLMGTCVPVSLAIKDFLISLGIDANVDSGDY